MKKKLILMGIVLLVILTSGSAYGYKMSVDRKVAQQEAALQKEQDNQKKLLEEKQKEVEANKTALDETNKKLEELNKKLDEKAKEAPKPAATTAPVTVKPASDPFPTRPDYKCEEKSDFDSMVCNAKESREFIDAKEAWYARHGQTAPAKTTTPQKTTTQCNYSPYQMLGSGI